MSAKSRGMMSTSTLLLIVVSFVSASLSHLSARFNKFDRINRLMISPNHEAYLRGYWIWKYLFKMRFPLLLLFASFFYFFLRLLNSSSFNLLVHSSEYGKIFTRNLRYTISSSRTPIVRTVTKFTVCYCIEGKIGNEKFFVVALRCARLMCYRANETCPSLMMITFACWGT